MKVNCMLDLKEYQNKPLGKEIGAITNRLVNASIEIEVDELANKLIKGCTFKPSNLTGKKETDWISEQLFALDFDEDTTIEIELNRCKELNILPVFGYTSFSHNEEHHKFRLVFCTNEVITDYTIAKKLQLTLMNIFNNCDEKCKNLSRLYFGGRQLIYEGFDNVMDYEDVLNRFKSLEIKVVEKSPQDNNRIYNNSYIILGTNTPPKTLETKEEDNYNIKAISNRDSEYLKKKLNRPHMIFSNNQEFCDYIFKEINLGELLEFKYAKSIRCIFHNDNSPSASIFKNENGYWIYNCFGCGVSYNLLGVIEVLGQFRSRPKAYKFIREIFNMEIQQTEWQIEQKDLLLHNLKTLNSGELEEKCPQTYKNIKSSMKYITQLLLIAMDNVYSEKFTDNEDNVVFYASTKYICKLLGMSEGSAKEVSKKNALFAYHNLLNKIDDNLVNADILKRSNAISINSQDKKYRHVNYYSIPSYNNMTFSEIELQGKKWVENNYTIKGLSREMFYRAEGQVVSDKLYPQYKKIYDKKEDKIIDRTTTKISQIRTDKIVEILFDILNARNYVTEREIIDEMIADGDVKITKGEAERQLKKSLQEILLSYDLKRIRCNKLIKEEYGIVENGYPFVLVRNNLQNEGDK